MDYNYERTENYQKENNENYWCLPKQYSIIANHENLKSEGVDVNCKSEMNKKEVPPKEESENPWEDIKEKGYEGYEGYEKGVLWSRNNMMSPMDESAVEFILEEEPRAESKPPSQGLNYMFLGERKGRKRTSAQATKLLGEVVNHKVFLTQKRFHQFK